MAHLNPNSLEITCPNEECRVAVGLHGSNYRILDFAGSERFRPLRPIHKFICGNCGHEARIRQHLLGAGYDRLAADEHRSLFCDAFITVTRICCVVIGPIIVFGLFRDFGRALGGEYPIGAVTTLIPILSVFLPVGLCLWWPLKSTRLAAVELDNQCANSWPLLASYVAAFTTIWMLPLLTGVNGPYQAFRAATSTEHLLASIPFYFALLISWVYRHRLVRFFMAHHETTHGVHTEHIEQHDN